MVNKGANLDRTPFVGIKILSTALFPAPTSFDNSQTAVTFTSKQTAQWRFGDCRRLDPDVGERYPHAEVSRCESSKTTKGTMVAFISA